MVHYKLTYLNGRGAAESSRLILHYANVDFEDIRLERDDFTKNYKSKMPFGQLPVLDVDGKQLAQSVAIARFLARKYGLAGKDGWEQAQVDALGDSLKDFINEIFAFMLALVGLTPDDKVWIIFWAKSRFQDALYKEKFLPASEKYFPILKKYLKDSGNGFYFKSGLTWVDFAFSEMFDTFNNFMPDFYDKHPELKKHSDKVKSVPQLQNYFKTRPFSKN